MLVGNCGRLTGGINLMPDAEPDDGTLDVVVIAPTGIAAWVSVVARVLTKSDRSTTDPRPLPLPDSRACASTTTQQIELDGDIIGEARHIEVEVQPRALIVRTEAAAPPATAECLTRSDRAAADADPARLRVALRTCARATPARTAAATCTAR